jgi:hypothetical protein
MIKLKDILNEVNRLDVEDIKPGVAFWDAGNKSSQKVEVVVENSMSTLWWTVLFDLKSMKVMEVGRLRQVAISGQVEAKLTPAMKNKIKKIAKNPEQAKFINQDDPNMVKKLMRVVK